MYTFLIIVIFILLMILFIPIYIFGRLYLFDSQQEQHSILRNYPILGKVRYITEKMGPELRQYLFNNNKEGKPFNRSEFEYVHKTEKYSRRTIRSCSERKFSEKRTSIVNNLFPSQRNELKIKQEPKNPTKLCYIDNVNPFSPKEHREDSVLDPYYLTGDY